MADVRSLLRSEQASRRINHPALSYTKSGLLNCTVCNLSIKSETLWPGHLKSANHRKNVQLSQNGGPAEGNVSKKRKIDAAQDDGRKKTKPLESGPGEELAGVAKHVEHKDAISGKGPVGERKSRDAVAGEERTDAPAPLDEAVETPLQQHDSPPAPAVNEDEWAAFEREVAPLAHDTVPTAPDFSSAVISAAPIRAVEMAAQKTAAGGRGKDLEVEDEREEEENRLAAELEEMEDLEERVRRLKEKRETLRINVAKVVDGQEGTAGIGEAPPGVPPVPQDDDEDDDGSDDVDDWFS